MEHVLSKIGETSQSPTPNEATGTHNRPQSASFHGLEWMLYDVGSFMSMVSCIECRSHLPQLFHAISPVLCTGDKQICQLNIVQRCRGSSEAQSCMKGRDESMKYKALFDGHLRNTSRPFRQSHYACVENECVKLHVQRIEGLLEGTSICMQGNKRLWHWYKKFHKSHGG